MLRAAVIGCGAIGRRHVEAIRSADDVELVAACDTDLDRAAACCERAYSTVEDLLAGEQLDVVTVATPDHLHFEPVTAALRAGRHVFCEKPLAMTLDEAREIARIADANGRSLAVDYNRRYGFGYAKAKRIVDNHAIGRVSHAFVRVTDAIPWFVSGRGSTALLSSLLTHHIDLLRWFCGEVRSVHCRLGPIPNGMEHHWDAVLTFAFEGGAVGTLIGGWRDRSSRTIELMEIGGTGGYVQIEDVQNEVRHFRLDADRFETFRPDYFKGDDTRFYDSLTAHLHDFLKRVPVNLPPLVSAADGVRGLEIVDAAIESHNSGHSIEV